MSARARRIGKEEGLLLLKVNKPTCHRDLDRITIFIGRILKYSAKSKRPFDRVDFENCFGEAGIWIMNIKKDTVRKGFDRLFSKTLDECNIMQRAFYNDIKFAITPAKDCFGFKVPELEEELRKTLTEFLIPFYNYILGEIGFKKIKSLKVVPLTRKEFRRLYIQENGTNYWVCPACLGEIHVLNIKEENNPELIQDSCTDIEHYMPKSIYPALVVSSDNLIPICKECNQVIKSDEDPVEKNQEGCLNDIFLPYRDSGMDQIAIKIEGSAGNRQIKIEAKDPVNISMRKKANNFKRIYKLEDQWTPRLKHIHISIVESIVADIMVESREVNRVEIKKALQKIIIKAERTEKTVQNSFLQKCYAQWLMNNRIADLCEDVKDCYN